VPEIKIPANLAGAFRSSLPIAEDLRLDGEADWGAMLVDTGARFSQFAVARSWERGIAVVPAGAQGLLDATWSGIDAAQTWSSADGLAKLDAIAQGGLAALDIMFDALGVVEGVPLIGTVAQVGLGIQKAFWGSWIAKHTKPPAPIGMRYDLDSDERFMQDVLAEIETGDLTRIFMPRIEKPEFSASTVMHPTNNKDRQTLVVPQGEVTGLGVVPGALQIPRMWQGQTGVPWSDYRPGAMAAAQIAWQLALGDLRGRIDVEKVRRAWGIFWSRVHATSTKWREEEKGSQENGWLWRVMDGALHPISLAPGPGYALPMFGVGKPKAQGGSGVPSMKQVTDDQLAKLDVTPGRAPTKRVTKFAAPASGSKSGAGAILVVGLILAGLGGGGGK